MAKELTFSSEARQRLVKGVDAVANTVKVTLGPKGRNVIIGKDFGCPQIVNDGVTIAKEIELKDKLENAGAQLLKEVSSKTNDVAGDGTTTASVLAQAIVHEGMKALEDGYNPILLKNGIDIALREVKRFIKENSKQVDNRAMLKQVASISAGNNDEIGELIAEAMEKVGKDGVITVEESNTTGTNLKISEGMQLDKGYLSPYFITDSERMEAVLEKPYVLCVNKKINLISDLIPILEFVTREGSSLLLIAEDVEGEALAGIVVNVMRKVLRCVAIKAPGFGDGRKNMLQDISVLTGGQLFTEELGIKLENVTPEFFGKATRVTVTKDETTIIVDDSTKEDIENHIKVLKAQMESIDDDWQQEKLKQRIAKLIGGVAVIEVGAASEVELKERKLRIEDALNATKAANEEGIVAGGGYTLLQAKKFLENDITLTNSEEAKGYSILKDSLHLPLYQIAENSGANGNFVVEECLERNLGYNAMSGNFENLLDIGVVDPAKVTRSALENAVSVASMLLTTEAAIVDEVKEEGCHCHDNQQAPMPIM